MVLYMYYHGRFSELQILWGNYYQSFYFKMDNETQGAICTMYIGGHSKIWIGI